MKKLLKTISIIMGSLIAILALYLVFMTITDYNPKETISLAVKNNNQKLLKKNSSLMLLTYNIGYCGMDDTQDFFMDGGTGSRSKSKEKTLENLESITNFIKNKNASFIFLQEVDIDATRSYHINQYKHINDNLSEYSAVFALNYKAPWIAVPITKPMGTVQSGLASFSKYKLESATRNQFPGKEKWPKQLGLLDRCFIESRIPVEGGNELVLLNVHLSAFDKGGIIRRQQLDFLKAYITKEYQQGNYVIVGGDWNHVLPGTDTSRFEAKQEWPEWLQKMPEDFKPEVFKWALDISTPTNRTVDVPYTKGVNYLSIIDGFLVSSNVNIENVKGHPLDFQNTDHNPVTLQFKLK